MKVTDEMLSAYIDGELAPDDAERLRQALSENKELEMRLATLKTPDELIAAAYGEIDNAPMPESVLALLKDAPSAANTGGGNIIAFPGARWLRAPQQWAAALAASVALAIGVGAGMQLASKPDQSGVMLAGAVDAKSALHRALMNTPSGETTALAGADKTLTPVLSFEAKDGRFCREFSVSGPASGQRAFACQSDGQWRIEVTIATVPDHGGYASASSGLLSQFDAIIDDAMAGDALDAIAERERIAEGWKQ